MTFADWVKLPDLDKIVLIECNVAREVEGDTWVASSGAYYTSFDPAVYGEVSTVEVNGILMTQEDSVAHCRANAGTFYYDFAAKRLYVHMTDGDAPETKVNGVYKYVLLAKFWVCITNRQPEDFRTIYAPQGLTNVVYYLPYLSEESLPTITQGVGNYYVGDITMQFGELTFNNDGWWYFAFESMLWHNAKIYVKVGAKESSYSDFATVFIGVIRSPEVDDDKASFEVKDFRISSLRDVPITDFWLSTYPSMTPEAEFQPIPIPFGRCRGVVPICIDELNFKYKPSAYAINAITAVYEAGIQLYPTTEYTVDLVNGEFTLLNDPLDHLITCDVEGVKCASDGSYSENFSDFTRFLLVTLNGISASDLDSTSFTGLKASRTQKGSLYLNSYMSSIDLIRLFQSSAVFQLVPALDGKWFVKYYSSGLTGVPVVYKEDLENIGIKYDTDGVFYKVVLKYLRDPATSEYQKVSVADDKVWHRYKQKATLEVETLLYDSVEAMTMAQFFLATVSVPPKYVDGMMGAVGLNMNPTDKLLLSKTIVDAEGQLITVFNGASAIYRILEFRKNLAPANTGFLGLDDSIATGEFHADSPHGDSHADSHVDTPHSDIAHIDSGAYSDHSDSHSDTPHADEHMDTFVDHHADGHGDYTDSWLLNRTYWDYMDGIFKSYTDGHSDSHFDYNDYGDGGYWKSSYFDEAHSDAAHVDTHSDAHIDAAHGDVAHADIEQYIDYQDSHVDTPHADSFIGGGGIYRSDVVYVAEVIHVVVV